MNQNRDKIIIGVFLLIVGFFGLLISITFFIRKDYFTWPIIGRIMHMPMMEKWNQESIEEINGTIKEIEIEQMEIELEVNGNEVEIHGPSWFWQKIKINEGDAIIIKGTYVYMMGPMEGWHKEFIPFELTINGKTYGEVNKGIPIWMQEIKWN